MAVRKKGLLTVIGLVIAAFVFLGVAYWLIVRMGGPEAEQWMEDSWETFRQFLLAHEFWLFAAIAVLPAFVLPVAPLLTLAGYWGKDEGVWLACGYSALAVIVNLSWTYWLATGPGRRIVEFILSHTKYEIPEPDKENELSWALILRLTPGVPFIFTNYALGLIGMPFLRYFLVSAPVLAVTAGGYVLIFAGIFGGGWKYFGMGLSVIVVLAVVARMVSREKDSLDDEDEHA